MPPSGRYLTISDFERKAEERARLRIGSSEDTTQAEEPPEDAGETLIKALEICRSNMQIMKPLLTDYPFLHYSGSHWCFHMDKARQGNWSDEFLWIFTPDCPKFKWWFNLHDFMCGRILNTIGDEILHLPELVEAGPVSLIHVSALLGYVHLLRLGLSRRPEDQERAFIIAGFFGHTEIVEEILSYPGFLTDGLHLKTLLNICCSKQGAIISLVLDSMESFLGVERAYTGVKVAIAGSIISGDAEIAKAMIVRFERITPGQIPSIESSIFRAAIRFARGYIWDLKIEESVVGDFEANMEDLFQREDWSPLMMACATGRKDIVELLLETDSVRPDARLLECSLIIASSLQNLDVIRTLLPLRNNFSIGSSMILLMMVDWDKSPKYQEVMEVLLDYVDVESIVTSPLGIRTLISQAVQYSHGPAVRRLLGRGARPEATDFRGRTALHYAAEAGDTQIMEEIIDAMSAESLEIKDNEGRSAYEVAVGAGNVEVTETLRLRMSASHAMTRSSSCEQA
jgi:hypothetical protein